MQQDMTNRKGIEKRGAVCILLTLLFCMCIIGAAYGEEPRTLAIGFVSLPGNDTIRPDGDHIALLVDSLQEVSKYTNWQYDYIMDTEPALLEKLAAGEIDLIGGLYYRDTLAQKVIYPHYVTGYSYGLLVTTSDNSDIQKNDYRSMQGKRIAAEAETSEAQRLAAYLQLNNIQSTVVPVGNASMALQQLNDGEVDMALVGGGDALGYRVVTRFIVEPYYFVASPDQQSLLDELDAAYEMILDANEDFIDILYARYFDENTASSLRLTNSEREAMAEMPPLRVAIADGFQPLQYYDEQNTPRGINIDTLSLISQQSGLSFEYVRAQNVSESFALVAEGKADAVLGLSMSDTAAAEHNLVMTSYFLDVYRVAICNKFIEYPSQGLTIALIPSMNFLVDDFTGDVIYADTLEECMRLVNNGTADYTYGSTFFLEYISKSQEFRNIQTITLPGTYDYTTIALRRPADPVLLTVLNKTIHTIGEDEYQNIILQNTTFQKQEQTLQSLIYTYPMAVVIVLSVLTGLIVIVTVIIALLRARHSRALNKTQYTDELTGTLNLAGFRRVATRLLQNNTKYALSYSTIKSFNYVNERFGYEEGDRVLRRIAETIRADIHENEAFCRASGGTYVALRVYDTPELLLQRLDSLDEKLWSITPQSDTEYHLRMRTGIYLRETAEGQPDVFGMMDRANVAQRQILPSAETPYLIYTPGMFDSILHNQDIESRMESALESGEFLVYLQPKHDLATLKPAGAEALVRWKSGDRIIPPGDFIPQFERNGFIAKLDRYVFTQCCQLLRHWIDHDMPYVPISVNVSRVQLYASDFIESYVAIKQAHQIPDGLLELEFTESIIFEDVERLIHIVRSLQNNGFECSIDDFGKGYSSLTMLKNIPADIIKLDAQFFDTGINRQRDTIIIESVVEIAKSLGMLSIAEGIEDRDQVRLLQMIGCEMAQGYVFSRPVDIHTFERYLDHKLLQNDDPFFPLPPEPETRAQ